MKKLLTCLLIGSILLPYTLADARNWRQSQQSRNEYYGRNTYQGYQTYKYPCQRDVLGSLPRFEMYYNPYANPFYYRPSPRTYPYLEYFGPNVIIVPDHYPSYYYDY